jgi:hypothetical protein
MGAGAPPRQLRTHKQRRRALQRRRCLGARRAAAAKPRPGCGLPPAHLPAALLLLQVWTHDVWPRQCSAMLNHRDNVSAAPPGCPTAPLRTAATPAAHSPHLLALSLALGCPPRLRASTPARLSSCHARPQERRAYASQEETEIFYNGGKTYDGLTVARAVDPSGSGKRKFSVEDFRYHVALVGGWVVQAGGAGWMDGG